MVIRVCLPRFRGVKILLQPKAMSMLLQFVEASVCLALLAPIRPRSLRWPLPRLKPRTSNAVCLVPWLAGRQHLIEQSAFFVQAVRSSCRILRVTSEREGDRLWEIVKVTQDRMPPYFQVESACEGLLYVMRFRFARCWRARQRPLAASALQRHGMNDFEHDKAVIYQTRYSPVDTCSTLVAAVL
jgi:hypothetical protein